MGFVEKRMRVIACDTEWPYSVDVICIEFVFDPCFCGSYELHDAQVYTIYCTVELHAPPVSAGVQVTSDMNWEEANASTALRPYLPLSRSYPPEGFFRAIRFWQHSVTCCKKKMCSGVSSSCKLIELNQELPSGEENRLCSFSKLYCQCYYRWITLTGLVLLTVLSTSWQLRGRGRDREWEREWEREKDQRRQGGRYTDLLQRHRTRLHCQDSSVQELQPGYQYPKAPAPLHLTP